MKQHSLIFFSYVSDFEVHNKNMSRVMWKCGPAWYTIINLVLSAPTVYKQSILKCTIVSPLNHFHCLAFLKWPNFLVFIQACLKVVTSLTLFMAGRYI